MRRAAWGRLTRSAHLGWLRRYKCGGYTAEVPESEGKEVTCRMLDREALRTKITKFAQLVRPLAASNSDAKKLVAALELKSFYPPGLVAVSVTKDTCQKDQGHWIGVC